LTCRGWILAFFPKYCCMPEKKYKWYKIADSVSELPFGVINLVDLEVAGKRVCLVRTSGGLAACAAKCPHAGGDMCEGFLDKNENIVCPIHRYVFNLETGRDVSGEGYFLKIYPVKESELGIFLGLEEGGLFSWLK
jgi:nitrite reductase/ring-hydroxylating ferredoxin subunit